MQSCRVMVSCIADFGRGGRVEGGGRKELVEEYLEDNDKIFGNFELWAGSG
jgi:hypothetical protein